MTRLPPHHWQTPWTIFCDFDGTISDCDVTDRLLENFGRPGWEDLETRWLNGEIGSAACMAGQVALLDMSRSELEALLSTVRVDADFLRFTQLAARCGFPLHIVSDGLDYAIYWLLARVGIGGVPVIANLLEQVGERRWQLRSPWASAACKGGSGVCKCAVMRQRAPAFSLLIGDGRSDFCLAHEASHVFARGSLLAECRRDSLPHTAVSNFREACAALEALTGLRGEPVPEAAFNPLRPWRLA
ncbi:TPA: HAD-IB family phosphatase [Pluralibacter gergoviae]|uniref:2-hydroxy-3-keto-5-methylthiopentenyl-1-phosphate phosphatase n=1 Tax=Pluralibacter gergoviae TaxID=61647 RepID=A0A0J5L2W1_PLUGE|nr:HAD-IB family phosphatase [Pluralibacter gergoviae]KMK14103.1 hypothetical protein ABW06_09525 [Pluralibacter gergoviae]KMK24483.1 hypothetical protein ABW10_10030 [Pluralibacter gergoviae]MBL3695564.1 HAD-IB family phosphatase [Pluralibacter gergoviae]HDS1149475.1 HAD-IB family phosphatase [Pluralibacter gergoviae]